MAMKLRAEGQVDIIDFGVSIRRGQAQYFKIAVENLKCTCSQYYFEDKKRGGEK